MTHELLDIFLGKHDCNGPNLRLDGPVAWTQIKNRRLNPFGGSGPGVSKSRVERAVNIYEARFCQQVEQAMKWVHKMSLKK